MVLENKRIILNYFVFRRAAVRKALEKLGKSILLLSDRSYFYNKARKTLLLFYSKFFFQMPAICHLSLELELCIFSSDDVSNRSWLEVDTSFAKAMLTSNVGTRDFGAWISNELSVTRTLLHYAKTVLGNLWQPCG